MDFSWTAEQIANKNRVVEFAKTLDCTDLDLRERNSTFAHKNWEACARFGIQSLAVPSEYNTTNTNTDLMSAVLAMEGMGYGCRDNGLTFALNTQMWTVQYPIHKFGTKEQRERYLPAMCAGTLIGAHAITEPDSGSDVFSMRTTATACEGGYRLNGEKRFISLGPIADVALILATVDPALGKWGITAFLVDRATEEFPEGFNVSPEREKMGLRTVPMCDLSFTDCFVPEANRLGPEKAGVSISNSCLELERCCILASQIGAMEHQLETAIAYAKNRCQFGQPIGKFQAVSGRIVDMKLRLETARLLLYKVAWLRQQNRNAMLEAALLKLHLSECNVESSLDAIRTHGGLGYMTETGVERDLRDAVGGLLYAGTTDIQRVIAARLLGL